MVLAGCLQIVQKVSCPNICILSCHDVAGGSDENRILDSFKASDLSITIITKQIVRIPRLINQYSELFDYFYNFRPSS